MKKQYGRQDTTRGLGNLNILPAWRKKEYCNLNLQKFFSNLLSFACLSLPLGHKVIEILSSDKLEAFILTRYRALFFGIGCGRQDPAVLKKRAQKEV